MFRKFCQENYKIAGWLVLGSFAVTLATYPPTTGHIYLFFKVGAFISSLWVFLWLGNAYTSNWVSEFISWKDEPLKRFMAGMLVMVVYTTGVVVILVYFFKLVLNFDIVDDLLVMIYVSLIITVIISLFMHGRSFLRDWRQAAIDAERAKQEQVKAQYEALRSQVNPHFLFNSLNALTNLVYENQDKAAAFIKQLSEVYRYVLDTRDRELVPLSDEVRFLESYLFLQRIRFGEKLQVTTDLKDLRTQVPPLALQLLLENAIKHNVISEDKPLIIRIVDDGDHITITNNVQNRVALSTNAPGMGLKNIRQRYEFLTSKPVVIEQSDSQFTVRLPLIMPVG